jgi:hypothetical protein
MAGIRAPEHFHIRQPTDKSMFNGRNANPPRYMEVGGAKNQGIWTKETGDPQSPQTNIAALERGGPTGRKVSKSSTRKNLD